MGSLLRFKLDDFLSNYHLQTFIEGRQCARAVDEYLTGSSSLPR